MINVLMNGNYPLNGITQIQCVLLFYFC